MYPGLRPSTLARGRPRRDVRGQERPHAARRVRAPGRRGLSTPRRRWRRTLGLPGWRCRRPRRGRLRQSEASHPTVVATLPDSYSKVAEHLLATCPGKFEPGEMRSCPKGAQELSTRDLANFGKHGPKLAKCCHSSFRLWPTSAKFGQFWWNFFG